MSSFPSFCFLFLFGECGPISSIRLAGGFPVPLSFCSEFSGAPSMFCLLYNPSVWLPLSKAQFLGCIATHRAKAMACLTAEMPGLLRWRQGLRVTVSPWPHGKGQSNALRRSSHVSRQRGVVRIPVGWMQPQAPIPLLWAKGKPAGGVLCCPSQHPTVLRVPSKSEVTCFPSTHSSAPQASHCANAPLLSPSVSRCFGLPVCILQQKCPSFRFLD